MRIRQATLDDVATILSLMRGYYRDDELDFDVDRATSTLTRLLVEPQWGNVYLFEVDAVAVGYLAICVGFSLELGGNDAYIDELFVLPEHRGRGYARQGVAEVALQLSRSGIRALHLEVDRGNEAAQQLYGALGFERRDRYFIMTKLLASDRAPG